MDRRSLLAFAVLLSVFMPAPHAAPQEPRPAAPAARPPAPPPVLSPEVHPDRRVTFRLRAPDARAVTVSGEWGSGATPLAKGADGVWSATIGPIEPDLYGYSFSVDGFRSLDPANPSVKPMRSNTTSILDVRGELPRLSDFADVPHGTVHLHDYPSRALGRLRSLRVYTPPGYETGRERLPILYLFHGSGDNEATWTALGRAHLILDNLIARKKAVPMIVAMPDGHAFVPQPGAAPAEGRTRALDAFRRDLLEDVVPFVERSYRVRAERQSRAIAGLSMGGNQALVIGLENTGMFGWIGGFSSAIFEPEKTIRGALEASKKVNGDVALLWIACGKDDRLVENARQLAKLLEAKGIRHEFHVTEGNHSWRVWRRHLADFAPRLFVKG